MPRYDYDCAACGTRFEVVHGVHADPPTACPTCGRGPIKKAFAPPTIHFKGSGWAKKERRAASPSSARSSSADEGTAPVTTSGTKDTASGAASTGGEGTGGAGKGEGSASSTPAPAASSD